MSALWRGDDDQMIFSRGNDIVNITSLDWKISVGDVPVMIFFDAAVKTFFFESAIVCNVRETC